MHVEVRGQCQVSSSMLSVLFFEPEYLTGLELAHWLEYLAGEYQETLSIALIPNTEISGILCCHSFGWRC